MRHDYKSMSTETAITLPVDQFILLIVAIVSSALAVMAWINKRTDKLKDEFDAEFRILDERIRTIQTNFPTRVDSIDTLIEVIREDMRDLRNRIEQHSH